MDDTIAAISTSSGVGAISIIRVSGEESINIVNKIFKGKDLNKVNSHTINYGHIIENEKIIDEVLVSVMKEPNTFTKENVVEVNCHGGIATTKKILELLLLNGCRLAEPGEFTKRAFLNGKLDLSQAEAVIDIINANDEYNVYSGENQLKGKLSEKINNDFAEFGVSLVNFFVQSVNFPQDDPTIISLKESLAKRADMSILGYNYTQERSFDVLQGAAQNEGTAGMFAGAGLGLGMGAAVGGSVAPAFGQTVSGILNTASPAGAACSKCGSALPQNAKFCPECGCPQQIVCCGKVLPAGTKFCPECGKSLNNG